MMELAKSLHRILTIMADTKFARPAKEKFVFNIETA
jgi:hypothetical protein